MDNVMKNIAMAFVPLVFLSGCVGAAIETTKECPETSGTLLAWELLDIDATKSSGENFESKIEMPTKKDFFEIRGKPDEIIYVDEVTETWVYETDEWCGLWVGYGLLVPLILPVCDGVDYITFEGAAVKHFKTTEARLTGAMGFVLFSSGKIGTADNCNGGAETGYGASLDEGLGYGASLDEFIDYGASLDETLSDEIETIRYPESRGLKTIVGKTALISLPSNIGDVVAVIDRETLLEPLRESENWVEVKTPSGDVGWIKKIMFKDIEH